MTTLTLQSLNGQMRAFPGIAGPLTVAIDHQDAKVCIRHVSGLGQEDSHEPAPDWRYDRLEPKLRKGEFWTHRGVPEPGETWKTPGSRPAWPMTPDNDPRFLPKYGKPMIVLRKENYPGSYPHKWIPYEDVRSSARPDLPPMPQGWWAPQYQSKEEARAINAGMPSPAAPEEGMVYDVSGFSSMEGAVYGIGQISPGAASAVAQAAAAPVAQAAKDAQAAGASPSFVESIIQFGSAAAALYIQKRQMDAQQELAKRQAAAQAAMLASQAKASGVPFQVEKPWYESPGVLIGGAVAVAGIGYAVIKSLSKKGRSR